jgi:hypothetical protein
MKKKPASRREISIAQRGQIVQRVIVDGWTTIEAAAAFNVPRPLVEAWVANFRRYGMASLRQDTGRTVIAEMVQLTIWRPVRAMYHKISIGLRGCLAAEALVQPVPFRHSNRERPR